MIIVKSDKDLSVFESRRSICLKISLILNLIIWLKFAACCWHVPQMLICTLKTFLLFTMYKGASNNPFYYVQQLMYYCVTMYNNLIFSNYFLLDRDKWHKNSYSGRTQLSDAHYNESIYAFSMLSDYLKY